MTPAGMARIWRKTLRAEAKGIRSHHARVAQTEQPRKGSTWVRRHWGQMTDDERTAFLQQRLDS